MTITNGAAENGGGIYVEEAGSEVTVNLNQLVLSGNTATVSGGGVFLYGDVGGALSNALLIDNNALNGAGLALSGAYFSVWNSTFSGNMASGTAGSIYGADESEIGIFNCIISENGDVEIALDAVGAAMCGGPDPRGLRALWHRAGGLRRGPAATVRPGAARPPLRGLRHRRSVHRGGAGDHP